MKRITVLYGGNQYSVAGDEYESLKTAIQEAAANGRTQWVEVNHGEGRPTTAELLVGPGISIALVIDADEE